MAWTKEERAEYMKRYRQENRERINASKRYWLRLNRERERARSRKDSKNYYDRHKDEADFKQKKCAAVKNWVANNRERWNAYQREYKKRKRANNENCNDS
jgi:hypothetical protein